MSNLTSLLTRDGLLSAAELEEAELRQVISGGELESILLELGAVAENTLTSYRAFLFEAPPASRADVMDVADELLRSVPRELALEHRLIPITRDGETLVVAAAEPLSRQARETVEGSLGAPIEVRISCEVRVAAALATHFGAALPPRLVRLVGDLDGRDAGAITHPTPSTRSGLGAGASELPDKRALFDDVGAGHLAGRGSPDALTWTDDGPNETPALRPFRRLRGPVSLEAGEKLLQRAGGRDEILAVFFGFARQFFDYTALFVTSGEHADGRAADGPGLGNDEIGALSIDIDSSGALATVRRTMAPFVGTLDRDEDDRRLAERLKRSPAEIAMVIPVVIRQKTVLYLFGDRDGEDFALDELMELVRFAPRVAEALESLIRQRKRRGYHSVETPSDAEERADLKATLRAATKRALSEPPPAPTSTTNDWHDGHGGTNVFVVPTEEGEGSWRSTHPPAPNTSEATVETTAEAAVETTAEARPSDATPARPRRELSPEELLGIPRTAPPPPPVDPSVIPVFDARRLDSSSS